jgi:hypothetical protein
MRTESYLPFLAGLIIIACGAIYWLGLSGPLLFDDRPALTANELVKVDGSVFDEWRTAALSSNSGKLRRPVSMLSFAGNHVVSRGFSPTDVKATNLLIHISIAVLLYYLFQAVIASLQLAPDATAC